MDGEEFNERFRYELADLFATLDGLMQQKKTLRHKIKDGVLNLDSDSHAPMDAKTLEEVCEIIKSEKKIYKTDKGLDISLRLRGLDDEAAIKLAFAIYASKANIRLNLNQNEIGANGALALAQAMGTRDYFVKLDISKNKIGDKGIRHFIDIFPQLKMGADINFNTFFISDEVQALLKEEVKKSPVPLRVTTHEEDIECDRFVALREYMPDIDISDPRIKSIFEFEDNLKNKIAQSEGEVEMDWSENPFYLSIKPDQIEWVAKVLVEKATLPLKIDFSNRDLSEATMKGVEFLVKNSKVPIEFLNFPRDQENIIYLTELATSKLVLNLRGTVYREQIQQAIESTETPICITFRGSCGEPYYLLNEAFFREKNGPEIKWAGPNLEIIEREWGYKIFEDYIDNAKVIKIELDKATTRKTIGLATRAIKEKAKVPVYVKCHRTYWQEEQHMQKEIRKTEGVAKNPEACVVFYHLIYKSDDAFVLQFAQYPDTMSITVDNSESFIYRLSADHIKLVLPDFFVDESSVQFLPTIFGNSKIDVQINKFVVNVNTEDSVEVIKTNLQKIADERNMSFRGVIYLKEELLEEFTVNAAENSVSALEATKVEEDQNESSASNTDDGDGKPDDSAGGGAVLSEKQEPKEISVFLSSEPELLDLHQEEFTLNETKEEKEYKESLGELEERLLLEAQRKDIDVDFELIPEESVPEIADIPMTKISGLFPVFNPISA